MFENWVMLEMLKARLNLGLPPDLFFFRSRAGLEVDFLIESPDRLLAAEVKAARTIASDFFTGLQGLSELLDAARPPRSVRAYLVYGGEAEQRRQGVTVVPWKQAAGAAWW